MIVDVAAVDRSGAQRAVDPDRTAEKLRDRAPIGAVHVDFVRIEHPVAGLPDDFHPLAGFRIDRVDARAQRTVRRRGDDSGVADGHLIADRGHAKVLHLAVDRNRFDVAVLNEGGPTGIGQLQVRDRRIDRDANIGLLALAAEGDQAESRVDFRIIRFGHEHRLAAVVHRAGFGMDRGERGDVQLIHVDRHQRSHQRGRTQRGGVDRIGMLKGVPDRIDGREKRAGPHRVDRPNPRHHGELRRRCGSQQRRQHGGGLRKHQIQHRRVAPAQPGVGQSFVADGKLTWGGEVGFRGGRCGGR